ncbi:DUF5447 family protein [Pseudomonas sp. sia0905]|uniref:lysogeny maintenance protein PflM n=1 Tax=Pseudomonas sp. sia0905 TaxID=2854783 RepID=UPI001C45DFB4|nr:DUF5447 family protein [Pseudomonas sp. sia0905]MBV7564165.1 DUF5447 family protein [Pseudomonas sp. sia0905]
MNRYLHQPHRPDCDCSVCYVKRLGPISLSPRCAQCRPVRCFPVVGQMRLVNGHWLHVSSTYRWVSGFICPQHSPTPRPPRYWYVVENIGKPTPYVPRWDLFELESEPCPASS